jgi:hypothetical protein
LQEDGVAVTADEMWGRTCLAYNIQAAIPDDLRDALARTQRDLGTVGLPPFNVCPSASLHLSIFALVPVRSPVAGKETYWANVSSQAAGDLERICRDRRSMALRFDELRVTRTAVIAATQAVPDLMTEIRSHFARWPAHPNWTMPVYDIAHVTLARFAATAEISGTLADEISARPLSLAGDVSRIQLVREKVYPSLEVDVLKEFRLRNA